MTTPAAMEARLRQFEQVMFDQLKQPGMTEALAKTIKYFSSSLKLAATPETYISLQASRLVLILQMLGVAMERMNLMRFQELASLENTHVKEPPVLKLVTDTNNNTNNKST